MYKNKKTKKQVEQRVVVVKDKPEWVTSFADNDQYKLSQSEMMQRKISHISKHRLEAKDSWQIVQDKLQKGIVDEDTNKIFETALTSKGLGIDKYGGVTRRNLTQMMQYEDTKRSQKESSVISSSQHDNNMEDIIDNYNIVDVARNLLNRGDDSKDLIKNIKQDLDDTKQLIKKVERFNTHDSNPARMLKQLQQTSSRKQSKSRNNSGKENRTPQNLQIQDIFQPTRLEDRYQNDNDDTCFIMKDIISNNDVSSFQVKNQSQIFDKTNDNKQRQEMLSTFNPRMDPEVINRREESPTQQYTDNTLKLITQNQFLEPVSPSKFFDFKTAVQETRISHRVEKHPEQNSRFVDQSKQDDKYDLDQLRQMLEITRQDLDKMNLNSSFLTCQQQPQLQPKLPGQVVQVQVNVNNFVPFLPNQNIYEQDDDFQPRTFTISQHQLKLKSMTQKIKRPENSFNISDYM